MNSNKKSILITGAAGFIGFHLSKSMLEENNYNIIGLDNMSDYYDVNLKKSRLKLLSKIQNFEFKNVDIMDFENLNNIFMKYTPFQVINLAAQAGVRYSIEDPNRYIDTNITGFMNVLECCRLNNVSNLIYSSSSSVYGANKKFPFSVEDSTNKPLSVYAVTKKTNELMAYSYHNLYKINSTGLRYFTAYGPWGRPDMAIFKFATNIYNDVSIDVFNNGEMYRSFTYIDDIIHGTKLAIKYNAKNCVFNLGNDKTVKVLEVVKLLENEIGKKAKINFLEMQPGDVQKTVPDLSISKEVLGFKPLISIEEGIHNFMNWFKKYYSFD